MDDLPSTAMAKRMFPMWFNHEALIVEMKFVAETRWHLAVNRIDKKSTAAKDAVKLAGELLGRIRNFQRDQEVKVQATFAKLNEMESSLTRRDLLLARLMHKEHPANMGTPEWEQDEDEDDIGHAPGWEREVDENEEQDQGFLATFDVVQTRAIRDDLLEKVTYYAVVFRDIEDEMSEFARRSKLRRDELENWTARTETGNMLSPLTTDFPTVRMKIVQCMKRRMGEVKARDNKVDLLADPEVVEREAEKLQSAILNRVFKPIHITHNPEHPHLPFHLTKETEGPNVCSYCKEPGHRHVECPVLYADEEDHDFCTSCRTSGHHLNECWILHPELKQEKEVAQEKWKKAYCEECGATGKARQYCYRVHGKTQTASSEASFVVDKRMGAIEQNQPLPASEIAPNALPWSPIEVFCFSCQKGGHWDKDCPAPPAKLVSIHDKYKQVKKQSKFAKTVK